MHQTCKNYCSGYCTVVSLYVLDTPVPENLCNACKNNVLPMQLNSTIVDFTTFRGSHRSRASWFNFWQKELKAEHKYLEDFAIYFSRHKNLYGPGTRLLKSAPWFFMQNSDCECDRRIRIMNEWGPYRCSRKLPRIVKWMRQSASNHGKSISTIRCYLILTYVVLHSYFELKNKCLSRTYNVNSFLTILAGLFKSFRQAR